MRETYCKPNYYLTFLGERFEFAFIIILIVVVGIFVIAFTEMMNGEVVHPGVFPDTSRPSSPTFTDLQAVQTGGYGYFFHQGEASCMTERLTLSSTLY